MLNMMSPIILVYIAVVFGSVSTGIKQAFNCLSNAIAECSDFK